MPTSVAATTEALLKSVWEPLFKDVCVKNPQGQVRFVVYALLGHCFNREIDTAQLNDLVMRLLQRPRKSVLTTFNNMATTALEQSRRCPELQQVCELLDKEYPANMLSQVIESRCGTNATRATEALVRMVRLQDPGAHVPTPTERQAGVYIQYHEFVRVWEYSTGILNAWLCAFWAGSWEGKSDPPPALVAMVREEVEAEAKVTWAAYQPEWLAAWKAGPKLWLAIMKRMGMPLKSWSWYNDNARDRYTKMVNDHMHERRYYTCEKARAIICAADHAANLAGLGDYWNALGHMKQQSLEKAGWYGTDGTSRSHNPAFYDMGMVSTRWRIDYHNKHGKFPTLKQWLKSSHCNNPMWQPLISVLNDSKAVLEEDEDVDLSAPNQPRQGLRQSKYDQRQIRHRLKTQGKAHDQGTVIQIYQSSDYDLDKAFDYIGGGRERASLIETAATAGDDDCAVQEQRSDVGAGSSGEASDTPDTEGVSSSGEETPPPEAERSNAAGKRPMAPASEPEAADKRQRTDTAAAAPPVAWTHDSLFAAALEKANKLKTGDGLRRSLRKMFQEGAISSIVRTMGADGNESSGSTVTVPMVPLFDQDGAVNPNWSRDMVARVLETDSGLMTRKSSTLAEGTRFNGSNNYTQNAINTVAELLGQQLFRRPPSRSAPSMAAKRRQ